MIEIDKVTDTMLNIDGMKAVIFDLDDTLYSEKEYVRSGYRAVAETLPQVKGAETKLWNAFVNHRSAIDEVLLSEGIYTEELKMQCLITYRYHQPIIHLYEGVEAMLNMLHHQEYLLGLITDGRPEGQQAKIEALGIKALFDHIIVTDELGGIEYRKPNEKAFVLMREKLDVEFSKMCYVGDNTKKDFIATEKLGMKAIWFKNRDSIYNR